MVYAFTLPTTGHLSLQTCIASESHPSLPQAASTARHALRQALKTYKRLPRGAQRDAQLASILTAITEYLPYLLTISKALNTTPLDPSSTAPAVEITLRGDLEPEWRPTLTASSARTLNHPPPRTRGHGLDFEIAFVLTTMGYVLSRLAHTHVIRTLYNRTTPSTEQRTTAVQSATKHLLQASAVHNLLASMPAITTTVPDLDPATQAALASLALAEATLLAVLKDDTYVAACIQARNPNDKDWMVRAPEIPKVRAHLFARLCLRAAEYADQAAAGLGAGAGKASVNDDLKRYVNVLGRVARARACRFFGADAELSGKIGEGIAWLRAAKSALGVRGTPAEPESGETKSRGLSKLKQGWLERREERRMGKDAGSREYTGDKGEFGPGDNAGREEEGRVIEMLETKWVHMNDTINTQLIPPSADLLANLPSGRDIHSPPAPYKIPALDEETLLRMRGPPREAEALQFSSDADSDEEPVGVGRTFTPGTVPERTDSAYY